MDFAKMEEKPMFNTIIDGWLQKYWGYFPLQIVFVESNF